MWRRHSGKIDLRVAGSGPQGGDQLHLKVNFDNVHSGLKKSKQTVWSGSQALHQIFR